jgi:hypothetical protein
MPSKWDQYAVDPATAGQQTAVQPTAVQKTPDSKWEQYAVPAADASSAEPQGLQQQADQWINDTFTDIPGRELHNMGSHAAKAILTPFVHPVQAAQSFEPKSAGEALLGPGATFGRQIYDMGKSAYQDYKQHGVGAALGDIAGPTVLGDAFDGIMRAPEAVRSAIAGPVDRPSAGSTLSPRQRFQAAQRVGVDLDAADATGSPVLGMLKRFNENSLAGGHLYDDLRARNTGALSSSTDSFLNSLYDGDRESGGRTILDALRTDQQGLKSGAETGFDQLTEQTKGKPVKGAPAVGDSAKQLLKTIAPLADKYPSLAPGKTMGVLNDLARVGGKEAPAAPSGFLDAPGSEFAAPRTFAPPQPDTWSDLQRLRSATHDLTTTNPDLVKSQAIAPLQQMTAALDDAMTNGQSGLTPEQAEIFRDANSKWKDMKATYDDPSSPFYHAVRTDNPSTLFGGVGPKTPENAINLRRRLSPFEDQMIGVGPNGPIMKTSQALGALRRGTVESALRPTNEGTPNFETFGSNFHRIPADYRAELFSPDQNATLQDLTHTANTIGKDFNPSGSGKLGQKVAEAAALVPTAGAPLLQYPLAKFMTSPKTAEWLLHAPTRPNPFFAPATAVAAGSRRRGDQ